MALLAAAACVAACGASGPPPPEEVVQNYEYALAEGNYTRACTFLDAHARAVLRRSMRPRVSCRKVYSRCLRYRATVARQDQSQLLSSNIDVRARGPRATVTVSGTPVARAVSRVTLALERGTWRLTSDGRAIERCLERTKRRRGSQSGSGG